MATSVAVLYLFIDFTGTNEFSHMRGVAFGARNLAAKELRRKPQQYIKHLNLN